MKENVQKIKFVVGLFVIVGIAFIFQSLTMSDALAADKVKMRLHWKVSGPHIPFIVAMEKGYYREEGIDISIKEGAGSAATVKLIGAGNETFGMAGASNTVKAAARGVPVMQVLQIYASKRQGVLSRPEAGIREPKDLIGKTIVGSGGGTSDIFEAFLAANNIPKEKVKYLSAGRARIQAFAAGKADGMLGLGVTDPVRLHGMGINPVQVLEFGKWGVPEHGDGVITHRDTYKKNPDLIRRFVKATIRGINLTFTDIEASADIAVKHFPMSKKANIIAQLENLKWLTPPPLGWQDPKIIVEIIDMIAKYAELPQAKDLPPSRYFTNEFLPQ